jgi:hypothetical protein
VTNISSQRLLARSTTSQKGTPHIRLLRLLAIIRATRGWCHYRGRMAVTEWAVEQGEDWEWERDKQSACGSEWGCENSESFEELVAEAEERKSCIEWVLLKAVLRIGRFGLGG